MNHHYLKVNGGLKEFVRTVLFLDDKPGKSSELPLFTNGTPALLCRTRGTPTGIQTILQLTVYGKSVPHEQWNLSKHETLIAYFFKPFSLPCLFNLDAKTLAKEPMKLDAWNAHKTNALKAQLVYAKNATEKIDALDRLLLQQLEQQQQECNIIQRATDYLLLKQGSEALSDLLKELNLLERTFQRIFKKYVGITPSQYRRICQFKSSFDQVRKGQFEKLSDIAFQTGFADQSHFIRSFKEFTEITPKDYKKSGLKKKNN